MFKFRIISFTVLLSVFVLMFVFPAPGGWIFGFAAALTAFAMTREMAGMLEKLELRAFVMPAAVYSGAAVLLSALSRLCGWDFRTCAAVGAALLAAPLVWGWGMLLCGSEFALNAKKLAVSFGILIMALPPVFGLLNIGLTDFKLFGYMVLVTKAGDTGAYCIGMLSNRISRGRNHPVAPRISPRKSIEGTVGGLVTSVGVSFLLGAGLDWISAGWPLLLILGVALFWGGFCGDLTESVLKRGCGIKDSGRLLPGMGGIWDIMDSFIYNAPVFSLIFPYLLLN
ncbi:MAG: phosphatidate cytidylyltransferase [Victivallaceae bacterium]|nr:phosphatidate cytidylyltransferase [Victivallaceae bacterium]